MNSSKLPENVENASEVPISENNPKQCVVYEMDGYFQIDTRLGPFPHYRLLGSVSTIIAAHIGINHSLWSFLTPAILKSLDSEILTPSRENNWEQKNNRQFFSCPIKISGRLDCDNEYRHLFMMPVHDHLSYNGCVHQSQINLHYEVEFHIFPGIQRANPVYDDHGWPRCILDRTDELRSMDLLRILQCHQTAKRINHDIAWKLTYGDDKQRNGR